MARKLAKTRRKPKRTKTFTARQVVYISIALFLAAFLIRFIYLNQLESMPNFDEPQMDERYHLEVANQINSGTLPDEPFFRAPLYLYFFAAVFNLTGESFYDTRLIQIILGSLLPVLILLLGVRVFNRTVAVVAAAIAVIYPTFIY
jgi:predicted membrane-bound mannosyltransferase